MNSRERLFAFLDGKTVDHLPFMPIFMQFASTRAGIAYGEYSTDYRVMVDCQLSAAEEFGVDHVSVISDPAVEASACGANIHRYDNSPFAIDEERPLLADKSVLTTLQVPDPLKEGGRMLNRIQAVALFKERVGGEKAIEGWIEGPCAEAADLRGINNLMVDFMDDPEFVRDTFEFVLEMEMRFAKEQVAAGADIIGVGDAAASLVGPRIYDEFVQPFERKMVDGIHALGAKARLHICGNTRRSLKGMGEMGFDIVDLDFPSPISEGRERMGFFQVLLGNIDPVRVLRNGTPDAVYQAIAECHNQAGERYIVGAGCEVPRDTPDENVKAMMRYAQEHGG